MMLETIFSVAVGSAKSRCRSCPPPRRKMKDACWPLRIFQFNSMHDEVRFIRLNGYFAAILMTTSI
jgi:hypothetical protein